MTMTNQSKHNVVNGVIIMPTDDFMYNNDRLDELGRIPAKEYAKKYGVERMLFGKHKGTLLSELPIEYVYWMLDNFKWTKWNKELKESFEKIKEKYIADL
jgi:hypothetical protein